MRTQYRSYILLFTIILSFPFCRKDGKVPILNLKKLCLITSDTTYITGKSGFSSYQFHPNSNRLMVARKVIGNAVLIDYREVHYMNNDMPDKTITYLNANEFYETKFFYRNGSVYPFKSEMYFTSKLSRIENTNLSGFRFYYDAKERVEKVEYVTTASGDQNYTLFISYNDDDNVIRMEYQFDPIQHLPNTVISVRAFDDHPNPYAPIPYWKFLMLNGSRDNFDPEHIITALSRNNPLEFTLGNFKRNMTYIYNQHGFPVTRYNFNKNTTGESSYKESFDYRYL
jgi:hypothetical protein